MEVIFEEKIREEFVYSGAMQMMAAARTSPKGKGIDNIAIAILKKKDLKELSDALVNFAKENNAADFFYRDAKNLLSADALFIAGARIKPANVAPCGMCGFKDCTEKEKYSGHPCALNITDLGIAIGSAVSVASRLHIDNRIMYTVGQLVLHKKLLGDDITVAYGIPLSVSSKNPFFDRK